MNWSPPPLQMWESLNNKSNIETLDNYHSELCLKISFHVNIPPDGSHAQSLSFSTFLISIARFFVISNLQSPMFLSATPL